MKKFIAIVLAMAALGAAPAPSVTELKSPAPADSLGPNLVAGPDGRAYLSWLEPAAKGFTLRFAVRSPQGWSAPKTIATGTNWFVSDVDFPAIAVLSDGTLAADWLVATGGPSSEAYDISLAFSKDMGATWSQPVVPHRDRKKRQHGFPSLTPTRDGKLAAIWLDGRNMPSEEEGNMALIATTIGPTGALGPEATIDTRTCECCKTALAATPDGLVAVYRDRSDKEIRDISISRFANGRWSAPENLSKDGWEIDGCPINGPAVASNGKNVAAAWFTAPGDKPAVYLMTSVDGGKTFGKKIRVDGGNGTGHVDVVSLPSGEAIVSWIERGGGTPPRLQVRKFSASGEGAAPINVSQTMGVRSGGFPRMVLAGNDLIVAWTDSAEPAHVRTAVVSF